MCARVRVSDSDARGGDACTARRPLGRTASKRPEPAAFHKDEERPCTASGRPLPLGGDGGGGGGGMPMPGYGDAQSWYGRGEVPPPELPPTQKPPRSSLSLRTAAGGPPSDGQPFKGRSSSCSFGLRTPLSDHHVPVGPGPLKYKIPEQLTRYGKSATPSYSMGRRYEPAPPTDPTVPGPGEYSPEVANKLQRGPAFTLLGRSRSPNSASTASLPAPNQYCLPPCIGIKVPHKPYSGAVRFNGRPKEDTRDYNKSPGPAQYALPSVSSYKTQAPRPSMTGNKHLSLVNDTAFTPAPSAYSVERASSAVQRRTPRFSFGVRHSAAAHTMMGPEDK